MALAIRSLGRRRRRERARPGRGAEDRRARDARGRRRGAGAAAGDLGPEDAPRAAPGVAGVDGPGRSTSAICSSCSRRASSAIPTSTAAAAGSTSASSPPPSGRSVDGDRGRRRARASARRASTCSTPASRRSPTPPRRAFLGREKLEADALGWRPPARGARRRRPRRHARRDPHDRADPRARRAGLRRRGDRHRRRRRPAADRGRRGRHPVLPGAPDRRSEPARRSSTRWPRAATTCSSRARRGRPGSRAWLLGAGPRPADGRQLPHRARRLRRPAHRPGQARGAGDRRAVGVLRRLRRRPLAQPGDR